LLALYYSDSSKTVKSTKKLQLVDGEDLLVCCSITPPPATTHGIEDGCIAEIMGNNGSKWTKGHDENLIQDSGVSSSPRKSRSFPPAAKADQNGNTTCTPLKTLQEIREETRLLREQFFSPPPKVVDDNSSTMFPTCKNVQPSTNRFGFRTQQPQSMLPVPKSKAIPVAKSGIATQNSTGSIPKLYSVPHPKSTSEPSPPSNPIADRKREGTEKWVCASKFVDTHLKSAPTRSEADSRRFTQPSKLTTGSYKDTGSYRPSVGYYGMRRPVESKPFYTMFTQPLYTQKKTEVVVANRPKKESPKTLKRDKTTTQDKSSMQETSPGGTSIIRSTTWTKCTGKSFFMSQQQKEQDFEERGRSKFRFDDDEYEEDFEDDMLRVRCPGTRDHSVNSTTSSVNTGTSSGLGRDNHQNVISDSEFLIDDEISDQPELTLTFKGEFAFNLYLISSV